MVQISLVSAYLATAALESLFFGIFLVLAVASIYFHMARRVASDKSRKIQLSTLFGPIFAGSLLITITIVGHWILTVIRLFDAFVHYEGGSVPEEFYSAIWFPSEAVKNAFLIATLIVCDVMLIYRLWTVWNHSYLIIVVPTLTVAGLCISGPGTIYEQAHLQPGNTVFVTALSRWITSAYACTFVYVPASMTCRGLTIFVGRIFTARVGSLKNILVTMVESAALYTTYTIFFFASYQSKSNLQYICIDTLCPIAGIAFMLINVRVGLGWAQRATPYATSGTSFRRAGGALHIGEALAMRPVAVDITTVVHRDIPDAVEQSQVKANYHSPSGYSS
ncbi:hypothetical protein DAEQUDRAFT_695621 [Daedalea quercina L-15889]|uniref:Uncharacterized protein n=1 Tax=Daedalea quercina L-15889 TaxID=1314783 RepID=A0A165N384_9APHY|nr:hypothetical protein DAEQUDRAFT_695621 [Daedalea quercina L-15889]